MDQAGAWRSFGEPKGPHHVLAPQNWCLQSWQEEVGRAGRAARPGSEAGAANLLSPLLCAFVQVISRLKLRLHSLIIYLGKEEELVNQDGLGRPRGQRCFAGAWESVTRFLYGSCEVKGRNTAQEPRAKLSCCGMVSSVLSTLGALVFLCIKWANKRHL